MFHMNGVFKYLYFKKFSHIYIQANIYVFMKLSQSFTILSLYFAYNVALSTFYHCCCQESSSQFNEKGYTQKGFYKKRRTPFSFHLKIDGGITLF